MPLRSKRSLDADARCQGDASRAREHTPRGPTGACRSTSALARMQFGSPSTFAIDCVHEPIPNEKGWVFGRMCVWIGGLRLGDLDVPACMLNVTAARLDGVIGRLSDLADPALEDLTDSQLYELLDKAIYRDDQQTPAQVAADAERFFKFDFLTNGGESFDGFKSFITGGSGHVRILFVGLGSERVGARLDAVAFVATVTAFLGWLRAEAKNAGQPVV